MFKKIKENEKLNKLKEYWHNPKTHDIIMLCFWLLFIVVVILFLKISTSVPKTPTQEITKYNTFEKIQNYDFTYKMDNKVIQGEAYNDKLLFYLNNNRYYYKDHVYLIDDIAIIDPNFDLDILKINPKMLNSLTENITPKKADNFNQYIVPLDKFINLYEESTTLDLSAASNYNIIINVYYKNDEINKIILDLSNYYNLKNNTQNIHLLTINYYNINNVSNFTKGYDKIIGGV